MPLEAAAPPGQPAASSLLAFLSIEAGFTAAFALILLRTRAQATTARLLGLALLGAVTHLLERSIVQLCLTNQRPHWAAAGASLLWVQLLSASDLLLARRVESSQLRDGGGGSAAAYYASAVGLLWNMRRIGTRWQVKNVPSAAMEQQQSRAAFVVSRVVATLVAYLVVDLVACAPPAEAHLVRADKATLLSLRSLGADDVVFRAIMTIIYWLITATLNLCMTNAGAVVAVTLGLSRPADCPPLYGSFAEAFTVRRFWGVSWHQMFRGFLSGHADLVVDKALPFVPRHSLVSRYARLTIAFLVSGLIHYRADQLMGVPDAEAGAMVFFLLQPLAIMLEDALSPVATAVLPASLRRPLGWIWVLSFIIWSTPRWSYGSARLGVDTAALLPVRLVGPWMGQLLKSSQ